MKQHAEQLLARAFEDDLNGAERAWLAAHLESCAACRDLQRDLTLAEERLERREVASDLPAPPELRPSGASGGWRRSVFLLGGAAAVVVVALAISTLREEPPAATGAPATGAPVANTPSVIFARHVVLDTVPGGGPVTTQAFDAFVVVMPGGSMRTHAIGGVGVGTPVFDGRSRVAYVRRASIVTQPSLQITGAAELVVWDVETERERVLLSPSDGVLNAEPLWSADRKWLVVSTRTAQGTGSAPQSRLLLIDAESGATRTLNVSAGGDGIGPLGSAIGRPLYVDAQVIVAIRGSSYVVLDATTGATRTQTPVRVRGSLLGESADFASSTDGTVLELLRRFESDAGPLWIWDVHDPARDIAKVDGRGISDPIFWPGRTEVVFTGPTGLAAVDYRSGHTRPIASAAGRIALVAVTPDGRFALARTDTGLQILERVGDELKARPDLSVTADSLLVPFGIFLP